MTYRRLTAVLACACVVVPMLMYVRDLGATAPLPTAGEASFDAGRLLASMSPRCTSLCTAQTLDASSTHSWRVRLTIGGWHRCYDLDPSAFGFSPDHGFRGVTAAPCRV